MADDFAEYIYGTKVRESEDGRVWELTPQSERRERVVRCRDCEFYEGGGCTLLDFSATDMDLGFCKWAVQRDNGDKE